MKKMILKELAIYGGLLLILAFLMHGASLSERFAIALENPSEFIHPLRNTLVVYLVILFFRLIVRFATKKRSHSSPDA